MTNTTLAERIKIFGNSQKDFEDLDEETIIWIIQGFVGSEIARAKKEWEQGVKEVSDDTNATPKTKQQMMDEVISRHKEVMHPLRTMYEDAKEAHKYAEKRYREAEAEEWLACRAELERINKLKD